MLDYTFSGTPGTQNEFYVDTSKAGEGDLNINITGPVIITPIITTIAAGHYKVCLKDVLHIVFEFFTYC